MNNLPPSPNMYRAYDPAEFEHLQVSAEMKDLFKHISRYTPQTVELDTKLKPFIPDFMPAIGDIDAFLKVAEIPYHYNKLLRVANICKYCECYGIAKITLQETYCSTMHTTFESIPDGKIKHI